MADFEKNYRLLGIQPGADWKQVRRAYKKLVNLWHPDRFHHDPRQRKIAEEKTKEITRSYQELAEYFKKFGAPPAVPETAAAADRGSPAPPANPAQPAADAPAPGDPEMPPAPSVHARRQGTKWRLRLAVVLALSGAVYLTWRFDAGGPEELAPPGNARVHHDAREALRDRDTGAHAPHFTIGSSLGEVYSIQGVPTRTENDVWHYGDSKVFFADGKVIRWEESMETPLRVALVPGAVTGNNRFFGRGSTKHEVLSAQGRPDRDAGSVWDYGASRVYFEGEIVTGWQEAPLYPLRVRE